MLTGFLQVFPLVFLFPTCLYDAATGEVVSDAHGLTSTRLDQSQWPKLLLAIPHIPMPAIGRC